MTIHDCRLLITEAATQWMEDKAARLGAALAYYMVFSVGPLLLISVSVAALMFGEEAARGQILHQVQGLVGKQGGEALQEMLAHSSQGSGSIIAAITGAVMLVVGATALFAQLQDALNTVWEVQPKPNRGWMAIIRERLLSFTMVAGFAFLLLISLVVSAVIAAVGSLFGDWQSGIFGQAINVVMSFAVITVLFAMIYKYLPDAKVAWSDVWFGAAVTSILFGIGKLAIGLYLGQSAPGSAYGAAGSLAVLLIWLYYSAQIFLFGAELTQAYATRFGNGITPTDNAMRVTRADRDQQGLAPKGSRAAAAKATT